MSNRVTVPCLHPYSITPSLRVRAWIIEPNRQDGPVFIVAAHSDEKKLVHLTVPREDMLNLAHGMQQAYYGPLGQLAMQVPPAWLPLARKLQEAAHEAR